jgi:hypothetical protein
MSALPPKADLDLHINEYTPQGLGTVDLGPIIKQLLTLPDANGIAIAHSVAFHLWAKPKIKREGSS